MTAVHIKNTEPPESVKKIVIHTRDSQGRIIGTMTLTSGMEIDTNVIFGQQTIDLLEG